MSVVVLHSASSSINHHLFVLSEFVQFSQSSSFDRDTRLEERWRRGVCSITEQRITITEDEIRGSLDRALVAKTIRGEICLFGGAVMVLAFHTRQSTKDVDAIFALATVIRELVAEIGRERGLDPD